MSIYWWEGEIAQKNAKVELNLKLNASYRKYLK